MSLETWLQRIWYGGAHPPWWLRRLSPVFGFLVRSRYWLYAHGWRRQVRVAAPVIVVGNISGGGTGKTPLVIWLALRLAGLGLSVAVVLRGEWRPGLRMLLAGSELQGVGGSGRGCALASFAGQRVHAVAGIGNPRRFFAALRMAGLQPIEHPFPDHHRFRPGDLEFGDALPVIMTEKDAVKCHAFAPAQCWYLPVTARFAPGHENALLERILMDARLLDILVCPLCKGPLRLASEASGKVLVCRADRLAYPIRDGIPVMLEEEARLLETTDPLLER